MENGKWDVLPLQQFSSRLVADLLKRQPPSPGRTRLAWQLAVGHALAKVTAVHLDGTVLRVRCADPRWTVELSRAREIVLARLQTVLGADAVKRIAIGDRTS